MIKDFKNEFEIRRVILGLSSIMKTPQNEIPDFINQKLTDIMVELSRLCQL